MASVAWGADTESNTIAAEESIVRILITALQLAWARDGRGFAGRPPHFLALKNRKIVWESSVLRPIFKRFLTSNSECSVPSHNAWKTLLEPPGLIQLIELRQREN